MAKKTVVKKILAVDDEADILWSLQEFLVNKDLQAQVFTAASGEEGLDVLARERIDLVITDIKMPGMSGLDLLVEIKNRFPYVSVIVMTAFPSSEYKRESLLKGGMYFIEKPFDIEMLRQQVIEALRDTGQFRGMLSGISLSDVIQIKCMSGVTAALRVSAGERQGIIFFQSGEIIHALCNELDGEEAFYEIISFAQGHLDTVNLTDLPERTICKPYVALLMEGSRRQDELGVLGAGASEAAVCKNRAGGGDELGKIGFGLAGAKPAKPPAPPRSDLLAAFKTITGYQAAAIMKVSGEIIAQDATSSKFDLPLVCATLNDFFRTTREATAKIGLEPCHEAVLGTLGDILIMGCSGDGYRDGSALLVLAFFNASGNQALGRREMRKVLARLASASI
ncbi:MAG: response regulator [Desulfobulbaceae bacterium]|nr:response regulator [Desulfobulbaceae bacterium]